MASFTAKLILAGAEFKVLACNYSLTQPTDAKGKPIASVSSGLIQVTLIGKNHDVLTNWAIDSEKKYDGVIEFIDKNGFEVFKRLSFSEGFCVSYREVFTPNITTENAFMFHLGITVAKMNIGTTKEHDNLWRYGV